MAARSQRRVVNDDNNHNNDLDGNVTLRVAAGASVSSSSGIAPPLGAARFADESELLGVPHVTSVSEKRVTNKAGLTQLAHHVCKNVSFDVRVPSASALDLTACAVSAELVFDARLAPLKRVELGHGGAKPMRCTMLVREHDVLLQVKISLLSSQVDGELFRLRVEALHSADGRAHVVYSAPLYVVSKPYLALRAEGDRSKPKPASHQPTTTRTTSNKRAAAAAAAAMTSSSTTTTNDATGGGVLAQLVAEQAAQRRLLERLLQRDADEASSSNSRRNKRRHSDDEEDVDDVKKRDDEEDDDDEYVEPRAKRARSTTMTTTTRRGSSLLRVATTARASPARADDDDDNDDNGASVSASSPAPSATSVTTVEAPTKALTAAIDALVAAFDATGDTAARDATLSALVPQRVLVALGVSGDGDGACTLFGAQGCPHARELAQLDAIYDASTTTALGGSATSGYRVDLVSLDDAFA